MAAKHERRRYTRIDFDGRAHLAQGDNHYDVHLIDVSLKGALVETPADYALRVEQPVTLTVTLAGDTRITMKVHLAHSSSTLLGFRCDSIDMESMSHLRRMIELNLEDPKASERVLDELITPQ